VTTGILGGAFDPPHNGHVALARAALHCLGLTRLLVSVSDRPGHKQVELAAPLRLRLAEAAFADVSGAEVRLDEHPFTIDMLEGGEFDGAYFVVGADQLAGFLAWRDPDRVLEHVRLAVGTRPGYTQALLEPVLEQLQRPERVVCFPLDEPVAVSSRELRALAARGAPLDALVPSRVARLISELQLYAPHPAPG